MKTVVIYFTKADDLKLLMKVMVKAIASNSDPYEHDDDADHDDDNNNDDDDDEEDDDDDDDDV
jgi:hypothetical protein